MEEAGDVVEELALASAALAGEVKKLEVYVSVDAVWKGAPPVGELSEVLSPRLRSVVKRLEGKGWRMVAAENYLVASEKAAVLASTAILEKRLEKGVRGKALVHIRSLPGWEQ